MASLIRLVGDFEIAEEAAQGAFAAAMNQWRAEVVREFPRAWIIQMARHKAIDRIRRSSLHQRSTVEEPDYGPTEIPENVMARPIRSSANGGRSSHPPGSV